MPLRVLSECLQGRLDLSPAPPNVPLLRALWSLLDGIRGVLKGSWGVLADGERRTKTLLIYTHAHTLNLH